ncbi:MAG: biotin/lipoyl-containing protein [Bacteroidaceae bacterium]
MKQYKYKVKGVEYAVNIQTIEGNIAKVEVNGIPFDVEMEGTILLSPSFSPSAPAPVAAPATPAAPVSAPAAPVAAAPAASGSGKAMKSPLPGVILAVNVTVGQVVKKGDVVVILEAMKMENNINAECDGTVTSISVNKGDSVMEGATMLTIG